MMKTDSVEQGMNPLNTVYENVDYAAVYSYNFYRANNGDLSDAFGDDIGAYLKHFVEYGMQEGRQGNARFSVHSFRKQHPELESLFGDNLKFYYMEYCRNPEYEAQEKKQPVSLEMNVQDGLQKEILEKAQKCNLILLRELDRVCRKYGLKYYLICGTLLGAVRHKDFVPWDDDVDVAMTRADFEILKQIAKDEWNGEKFLFVDYCDMKNGAFLDFMSRLVYMEEEVPVITFQKIRGKGREDIDNHIPLDIYILDNASDNEKKHKRQTMILQGLYGMGMGHRAYIDFSEYEDTAADLQKKIRLLINTGRIIPLKLIFKIYEHVRRKYNKRETENYIMSNGFIFCIPWKHKREWFGNGTYVMIGEDKFMAPANWDAYLRKQYGDYMRLPAVEDRHPTHTFGATGIYHRIDYTKGTERMEI